jgi:hypothetical protein
MMETTLIVGIALLLVGCIGGFVLGAALAVLVLRRTR